MQLPLAVRTAFSALITVVMLSWVASPAQADVTLYAASSLVDVLEDLGRSFEQEQGINVTIVSGASSSLARQIISGAPADLYISANLEWADIVAAEPPFAAPFAVIGNELVLISDGLADVSANLRELPSLLGAGRLAVGDPMHVPAGKYAQIALENAGIWQELAPRLAPAADVRTAVSYVLQGAAHFGLVYRTDVRDGVTLITEVDPMLYPPVIYYGVALQTPGAELTAFLTYLKSQAALSLFLGMGFKAVEAVPL